MGSVQYEDLAVTAVDSTDVHMVRRGAGPYTMALVQDVDPATKQDLLVSAVNIKTINGTTILGAGDLTITVGAAWGAITGTLADQTDLQAALDAKLASSAVSAFGLTLIDDANAAAARTTLGLGTLATQSGTFSGTSSGTNTGDQTITLTGEVTGTGTGSFATTIAAGAVTYAKMQATALGNVVLGKSGAAGNVTEIQLGTNQFLGRGAGNVTVIGIDATLTITGSTLGVTPGTFALVAGQVFSGAISATNLSGTNTGDQTSIVGITGTKAQFDTAVSDGNILYVGDVTQYTDEMVDDRVAALLVAGPGITFVYDDGAGTLTASNTEWTYSILAADFPVTSTTAADAFGITLPVNKLVEIEAVLFMSTSVSGDAPRPGWKWPTAGAAFGAGMAQIMTGTTTVTSRIMSASEGNADLTGTATPSTTDAIYAKFHTLLRTTSPVTGNFIVTFRGETANTVTLLKDSFIRYRAVNKQ